MPGIQIDEDTLLQASSSSAELCPAENPFQGLFFIHLYYDQFRSTFNKVFVQCCNLFKQPIISGLKLLPLHNSCRFPCLWDMYMWGLTNQSCFWPQLPRSFPYRMVGWKLASASVMTVLCKHWLGHETREAIQLHIFETPLLSLMLPE